jgi:proteic killer suppression protein
MAIRSYRDQRVELLTKGGVPRGFPSDLVGAARRKLFYLESAGDLRDLMRPPANRLEALKGNRAGQHSIRINDQWRICFRWIDGNAEDVEVVDYHR